MIRKLNYIFYQIIFIVAVIFSSSSFGAESALTEISNSAKKNNWVAGWKDTSSMKSVRTGAAIYYSNKYIYMIGGLGLDENDKREDSKKQPAYLRTSEYARVNQDGTVSSWQTGPNLNVERGFFAAAQHNNFLYAVGGGRGENGKELLSSIERAEIKKDGTLGDWTMEKSSLNISRRCVKVAIIGNTIYAFGGYGGILLDTVEQAEINPDGSLGEWLVATDPMIVARYVHGVINIDDGAYNIGGHSKAGGAGITDVGWSKLGEDNFFLPWKKRTSLQSGRYALATAAHNGFIYAIGGLNGATHLSTIERSKTLTNGELSSWTDTTPTPFAISGASSAVINNKIYLLGGSDERSYLNKVFYAEFNEQGDIGFWATQTELEQHKAAITSRESARRPPLPHEGVITKHFKQKLYSYLQVRKDNGNVFWLAGPATDLKVGDRIGFPNGTLMKDFYSKGLERTFPFILFITETRKLD
jgi:N-acetylneuraminic acid mutarotase